MESRFKRLEANMAQVWADDGADYGQQPRKVRWLETPEQQFQDVPNGKILKVYTATLSYLPESPQGTVGRADLCGRNAQGSAIWRLQVVYVEKQRTLHLTFPQGLDVGPGGFVEVLATDDGSATPNPTGPGSIHYSFTATLDSVPLVRRPRFTRKRV
jgi:hypothetical protein